MGIKLQRGQVESVTAPDKEGAMTCRIGEHDVKVPRELVDSIGKGDDVLVAGKLSGDVLQALAVKNLKLNKTAQVDCTWYSLTLGGGTIVGILCGVIGAQEIGGPLMGTINDTLSIVGLISAAWAAQHVIPILKAGNAVIYP